jgi:signal transduction histidine kinase
MITLKEWFHSNSILPLLKTMVLIVIAWGLTSLFMIRKTQSEFNDTLFQATKSIGLTLTQKNQVLLESLLVSAKKNLNLKSIAICKNNDYIYSVNDNYDICSSNSLEVLAHLNGFDGIVVKGKIDFFALYFSVGIFIFSGLLLIIVILLRLKNIQENIHLQLVTPLIEGLISENSLANKKGFFQIEEFHNLKVNLETAKEIEKIKLVAETAEQVSHDIRSPLSVLNLISSTLTDIPEETRITLRSVSNRINDIANQLLQKSQNKQVNRNIGQSVDHLLKQPVNTISDLTFELLPAIIDMLVSEKRIQFRTDSSVSIETDLVESYGAFAKINSIEFKRVISNLINNAVEAIKRPDGRVVVAVKNYDTKIIVSIRDNGSGIPAHILSQLGQQGVTYGKAGTESGSGLGVYHAKRTIESFDAKFVINSRENFGTEIRMEFPKCETPNWFVPELKLKLNQTIVALDDDSSVLELWKQRFKDLNNPNITLLTYTSELEFADWVSSNTDIISESLFLMDFELLGQKNTGLQLIEQLNLSTNAILVTSRYEEPSITSKCAQLGVKLLPKGMAGLVPIEFITSV